MRAAIYARVSSAAQRDRHTIEGQLSALPVYVAAQGWTLAGTYVDDGRSARAGKLDAREGFARLVADAEARKFDVLCVVDVDRLTRTDDMTERAAILGPFQRLGIDIVTPAGGRLDMRSMMGELYVTLQALFAAEENRKRVARGISGRRTALANGRKPQGPTPFGLRYDRASGWSICPQRGPIAREIIERVIGGESARAISDDFEARGIPGARGGSWARHYVWQIARSPHLCGRWTADRKRKIVINVPAIVSEEQWQAAQAALSRHQLRGLAHSRRVYLLESIATCGCGRPIRIRSATRSRTDARRNSAAAYVCGGRRAHDCDAPPVRVDTADAAVWVAVQRTLARPALPAELAQLDADRTASVRDWTADADGYRTHLARLDRVAASLLARYRRGQIPEVAMDIEIAASARERSAVAVQLAAAERVAAQGEPAASLVDWEAELPRLASAATPEQRRDVVQLLAKGVRIVDGEIRFGLAVSDRQAVRASTSSEHVATIRIRVVR